MNDENPTASSEVGASITDRLEQFLAPEPPAKEAKPEPSQDAAPAEGVETETDKPDDGEPTESQQPQLTTTDLAKVLGIDESALDVDADGNISVKTKIDGKDGAAKFAELVKSYQLQGHAENRAREVAEQSKALETRKHEQEQLFQQRLTNAENLVNIAASELMSEYQSYDWKALDQHPDQGAVAALKLKFQERQQKIRTAFDGIEASKAQKGQEAEAKQAERLRSEAEKLPTFIPEWKDKAVAAKETKELAEWMEGRGYTREAVRALNNSSALDVATFRDAMMYRRLQESKAVVEQKVRTAPKIVPPSAAKTDGPGQAIRDLHAQVVKSGGKNGSVARYLLAAGKA